VLQGSFRQKAIIARASSSPAPVWSSADGSGTPVALEIVRVPTLGEGKSLATIPYMPGMKVGDADTPLHSWTPAPNTEGHCGQLGLGNPVWTV
jgi:hypothetical protein